MDSTKQIGEMVASDYRSATVFRKYGIDFCCGGGKTLTAVCNAKGIDETQVWADLRAIQQEAPLENDFNAWSLGRLTDYIMETHHQYTRRAIGDLSQYLTKVEKVHGHHNLELTDILKNFELLAAELTSHMQKEEMILFPYIKEMSNCKEKELPMAPPPFGTIENPIRMMEHEHDNAGDNMKAMRELSNNFTPPPHACNTYMVAFKLLEEFEQDLHKHIHLENNILFPKAIALEKQLQL